MYTEEYITMRPMPKDISIKELRQNLSEIANRVEKGESYRVIRRSKPSFFILNIDSEVPEEDWETIVDFTDGGKTNGVRAEEVINMIRKIQR